MHCTASAKPAAVATRSDDRQASPWRYRWTTTDDIERVFAPQNWAYAAANVTRAYTAPCPTLSEYAARFGQQFAADWVELQMLALFGSSSNQSKGVADGIPLFAASFAAEAGRYRLTELMLFFARYKAGRYDKSFATFDCRRIGNAFFREFLPERTDELYRIEQGRRQTEERERQRRADAEAQRRIPEGYDAFTWFLHCKHEYMLRHPDAPPGFFDEQARTFEL